MSNQIFFIHFQTLDLEKKRKKIDEKKRRENRKKSQFVIDYHTHFHEPNNSNILYPFVPDREINDMILIIKSNISSYN